jgi:hypothetical protein
MNSIVSWLVRSDMGKEYIVAGFSTPYMMLEVPSALKKSMLVFWVARPCGIVGRYRRFGETYCLHLQGHLQT